MPDEGKIHCPHCNYIGHKPMLKIHLYVAHGIDYKEDNQK